MECASTEQLFNVLKYLGLDPDVCFVLDIWLQFWDFHTQWEAKSLCSFLKGRDSNFHLSLNRKKFFLIGNHCAFSVEGGKYFQLLSALFFNSLGTVSSLQNL